MLVGGDFNTEYHVQAPSNMKVDENHMRTVYAPYYDFNPNAGPIEEKYKQFYLLSNPLQKTAFSMGLISTLSPSARFGYDHVASNFAENKEPCKRLPQTRGFDHRSTFCRLIGFETGIASASYQALDSTGQQAPTIMPSKFVGNYKGVTLNYLSRPPAHKATAFVPAGIPVTLFLQTQCSHALEIKLPVNVTPYQTLDLGIQRRAVHRGICP